MATPGAPRGRAGARIARRDLLLASLGLSCGKRAARVEEQAPASAAPAPRAPAELTLRNVSCETAREFYAELDPLFAQRWLAQSGQRVTVLSSHAESGKQARAVLDGLDADVVTLALAPEITALAQKPALVPSTWARRLPHRSSPHGSTIVLLVRNGNPKRVERFGDLAKPGLSVLLRSPAASRSARWSYLALLGAVRREAGGDDEKARDVVGRILRNVRTLDMDERAAASAFATDEAGDVLLTWENAALATVARAENREAALVVPPESIRIELPVSIVDGIVDKRGSRAAAQAYVAFLFGPQAQELAAKHHLRPSDPAVLRRHARKFRDVTLFTVEEAFGSWEQAEAQFGAGGSFESVR
jgi:sulfate transport system substrate-binding protein